MVNLWCGCVLCFMCMACLLCAYVFFFISRWFFSLPWSLSPFYPTYPIGTQSLSLPKSLPKSLPRPTCLHADRGPSVPSSTPPPSRSSASTQRAMLRPSSPLSRARAASSPLDKSSCRCGSKRSGVWQRARDAVPTPPTLCCTGLRCDWDGYLGLCMLSLHFL